MKRNMCRVFRETASVYMRNVSMWSYSTHQHKTKRHTLLRTVENPRIYVSSPLVKISIFLDFSQPNYGIWIQQLPLVQSGLWGPTQSWAWTLNVHSIYLSNSTQMLPLPEMYPSSCPQVKKKKKFLFCLNYFQVFHRPS